MEVAPIPTPRRLLALIAPTQVSAVHLMLTTDGEQLVWPERQLIGAYFGRGARAAMRLRPVRGSHAIRCHLALSLTSSRVLFL